jgi:rhodanese-related sulfurtransferase
VKKVLQEGALVAVIGAALALAANALSPYRIDLSKDPHPSRRAASPSTSPGTNVAATAAASPNSPLAMLAARMRDNGLQLADSNQVAQFFNDPRRLQDAVIFIDAREDELYQAGHIPGAYHFYHYYPERYLTNVIPVCLTAEQIVFYCNGGECDLSLDAAITLRDAIQIPKEKLYVYGGGFHEWVTNGLPVELGARNSGQLTNLVQTVTAPKAGGPKQ